MAMRDKAKPDRDMLPVSRRELGGLVIGGGVALAALPGSSAAMSALPPGGKPVVGFHNDAPWLDGSGRDKPYRPPVVTGRFVPDSESLMRLGHFL